MSFISTKNITTLKCDRCGKTYELIESTRHNGVRKYTLFRRDKFDLDLCNECYEDFKNWLNRRF